MKAFIFSKLGEVGKNLMFPDFPIIETIIL